jgi:hypothetical protein
MSLITGFKLQVEEYASQATWIEKLLRPLNNFSQSAVNAVNGGLIVGQNVMATYKTSRVVIPPLVWVNLTPENSTQTAGEPTLGYRVAWDGSVYIRGAVAPTTKSNGTVLWTLPSASLYPEATLTLMLNHDHGSSHAYCTVSASDGKLRIYNLNASATNVFFNETYFLAKNPPALPTFTGPDWPLRLATDMPAMVKSLIVANCVDVETSLALGHGLAGVDWSQATRNEIVVRRINGLTPNRSYDVTFLMFGG